MDRLSTFTVSSCVPREHPTYATRGQPTRKSLQIQAGTGQELPEVAIRQDKEGITEFVPRCTPVHERELVWRISLYKLGFFFANFWLSNCTLKMTSGGWKEGSGEAPYAVWFSPAGPLCVQPHGGQALEGGQRSQRPATHGSKERWAGEEDTQPQPDLGLAGRPSSCLSALSHHTRLFTKLSFKQTRRGINNSG